MVNADLFSFHLEDVRNITKIIPKRYVDVTITSPPYGNLKNYEKGIPPELCSKQVGFGQSYEIYLDDLQVIFKNILKVTKKTGSLWVVVNTFKDKEKLRLLPFDLVKRLEEIGWKLQDIIIWDKVTKSLPWSRKGQFRDIFEYILFFSKSKKFKYYIDRIKELELKDWWIKYPERYNPRGKVPTNIWGFQIPIQGSWSKGYLRHFCPFPTELVERIILLTTNKNNVVLDPFSGSGIVLAVAECLQRRYIGFELNKDYIERLETGVLPQIEKELRNRKQEMNLRYRKRIKKIEGIKKLRQVKYPKTLIDRLLKLYEQNNLDEFPIHSIFAISKKFSRDKNKSKFKFMKEDVYLIFDKEIDTEILNQAILQVSTRPPLSKFGIDATIYILNKKEFIKKHKMEQLFDDLNLWLYVKGITNIFEKQITFSEWKNNFQNEWMDEKYPPIISNIKVNYS